MPPRPNLLKAFRGLSLHQPQQTASYASCISHFPRLRPATATASTTTRCYSDQSNNWEPPQHEEGAPEEEPLPVVSGGDGRRPVPQLEPLGSEHGVLVQFEPRPPKKKQEVEKPKTDEEYEADLKRRGLKFDPPPYPQPPRSHLKERYDPILKQMTNEIMEHGKLAKAQRHMALMLNFLQTSPAPKINPAKPLAPGSPPPAQLPLDPLVYLRVAIDSVAPLLKVRRYKGLAGGGKALEVPYPLTLKQRRRVVIKWILESVAKRPANLSGREQFAYRIAQELIGIVQGSSGLWDKRTVVHRAGTTARANIGSSKLKKRRPGQGSF